MQPLLLDLGCSDILHVCEWMVCMNMGTIMPRCTRGAQRNTLTVPISLLLSLVFVVH